MDVDSLQSTGVLPDGAARIAGEMDLVSPGQQTPYQKHNLVLAAPPAQLMVNVQNLDRNPSYSSPRA